ncbi:MAG: DUF1549 domain-containing protein, partial [Verrucomicrobiota bacterium]
EQLTKAQIALIEKWVAEGAAVPERYGAATETVELTHWSFLPVKRPSAADDIDGFIQLRLKDTGLRPSPEADRRTLIRRLFLVMLGLPPSPDRVEAFVNDPREDAWQLLVEEVLASPRYGERWASHWLDLARFGETHGFETNRERPTAWHFRDWVIAAFNDDKPYDQFVREQIAGDVLGEDIGTGFLVAGPWDNVKGQDPNLGLMQRMNELDDMINTTGTAFLGLTTGCARCHNHKFDPISQKDYYAMQAVFAGVQHGDRALPLPEETKERVAALDAEIKSLTKQLTKFIAKPASGVVPIDDELAEHVVEKRGNGVRLGGPKPNLSGGSYTWWTNTPGVEVARYVAGSKGKHRIWLSWGAGHKTHTNDAVYKLNGKEIAKVDQQLLADGNGEVENKSLWSGLYDAGVHDLNPSDVVTLSGGETGSAITADVVIFQPVEDANLVVQPTLAPAVTAKSNVDIFPPTDAKFVRFTIDKSSSSQPCIDELEVFSDDSNVALGGTPTSNGDFVHALHK